MKKTVIIIVVLIIIAGLVTFFVADKTDYKQLGYDMGVMACEKYEESLKGTDPTEEGFRSAVKFWIAFMGDEYITEQITDILDRDVIIAELEIPECKLNDWNMGVNKAIAEWFNKY